MSSESLRTLVMACGLVLLADIIGPFVMPIFGLTYGGALAFTTECLAAALGYFAQRPHSRSHAPS